MEKDNAKYDSYINELKNHHEILNDKIDKLSRNPNIHARPEEIVELKKQRLSIKDKLQNQ